MQIISGDRMGRWQLGWLKYQQTPLGPTQVSEPLASLQWDKGIAADVQTDRWSLGLEKCMQQKQELFEQNSFPAFGGGK